jgi:hypothetical protein
MLASGVDTFSRAGLDDANKRLRGSDTSVYCVGVGEQLFNSAELSGAMSSLGRLNYYQAKSQLQSFAQMTGGRTWFPRFEGEITGIMADVATRLRNNIAWPTYRATRSATKNITRSRSKS